MQVSRRSDEIGQLQRSFQTMQQSLGSYIQEVRQQTTTLEERNAQLLEAYEHAKEDERIKTTVLHNMPEKIVTQVTALVQLSRTISQEYRQMDTGELDATVKEIQADTTQVTNMLDELMATVQRNTPKKHVEPHKPTQPHE
jgi:sigma-B regulation protein RsbU (phosphoserine phosphatase)